MKFVSWNVNGLRACMNKGFHTFFDQMDADIFIDKQISFLSLLSQGFRGFFVFYVPLLFMLLTHHFHLCVSCFLRRNGGFLQRWSLQYYAIH